MTDNSQANNILLTDIITVHDAMPSYMFIAGFKSTLASYEYSSINEPTDIIITIDSQSEKEYKEELNKKKLKELKNIELNYLTFKKNQELDTLEETLEENLEKSYLERFDLFKKTKKTLENETKKLFDKKKGKYIYKDKNLGKKEAIIERMVERFKKDREEKRNFIEEMIKSNNIPNLNIDYIESIGKNGNVSGPRNKATDIATGKYIRYKDGDDIDRIESIEKFFKEIKNNELPNPEERENINGEMEKGPFNIIKLDIYGKSAWSTLYKNTEDVGFISGIGSEDGFFKASLLQKGYKIVYAKGENFGINSNYEASDSTIIDDKKKFETAIRITNYLAIHNKNNMHLYKEFEVKKGVLDYNNIFQIFNSGYNCSGYGCFYRSLLPNSGNINLIDKYKGAIPSIICSLILYPEILSDTEERKFFSDVRKILKDKIKKGEEFSILEILQNTNKYNEIFNKIKLNFEQPGVFENYFSKIDEYLDEDKMKIFKNVLSQLNLNKNNEVDKITNSHVTGDFSEIPWVVKFYKYFSIDVLKNMPEKNQIMKMNKILNGKFFPKEILIKDPLIKDNIEKSKIQTTDFAIQYLYNSTKESNKQYLVDLIKKTPKYKESEEVRNIFNKYFKEEKILNAEEKINSIKINQVTKNFDNLEQVPQLFL